MTQVCRLKYSAEFSTYCKTFQISTQHFCHNKRTYVTHTSSYCSLLYATRAWHTGIPSCREGVRTHTHMRCLETLAIVLQLVQLLDELPTFPVTLPR